MCAIGRFVLGYRWGTVWNPTDGSGAFPRVGKGCGGGYILRRGNVRFGKESGQAAFRKAGGDSRHWATVGFPNEDQIWKMAGLGSRSKTAKPPETNITGIVYGLLRSSSGRGRSVLATLWGRAVVPPSVAKRIEAMTPSQEHCA